MQHWYNFRLLPSCQAQVCQFSKSGEGSHVDKEVLPLVTAVVNSILSLKVKS